MTKRVISIMLIAVLLVSVLPVTAYAASGTSRYDAIPVAFDEAYTHVWTTENDEKDHYISFTVPSRGLIAMACFYPVASDNTYGDMQFEIYNQSGTCIWRTNTDYETPVEGLAIAITGLNAGKYYMNITPRFTVASGEFGIIYALSFVAADDTMGTEAEPNNDKPMADTLTVGKEFAGTVGENAGDLACGYDYWKFNNTSAAGYRVYFPELEAFRSHGEILFEDSTGKTTEIDLYDDIKMAGDGVYYFEIKTPKGTNYLRLHNGDRALVPYTLKLEAFTNAPVVITKQPASVAVTEYQTAMASVEATGDMLSYAWYVKDYGNTEFTLSSVVTNEYSVSMRDNTNCQQIYCVITDVYGNTAQSDTVTLSMLKIMKNPKEVLAAAGETAVVQVEAMGDGLTYQWYAKNKGDTEFSTATGFTESTYSVTMDASVSGRQLYCVVTDRFGNTKQSNTVAIAIPEDLRDSGTCGDNVTWELTYDGRLTISGTGPMQDYAEQRDRPWNPHRNTVKKIVVEEGVTRIGSGAFWYCENALTVELPETVESIGARAFCYCKALTGVEFPSGLKSIGNSAFMQCESITELKFPDSITEIGTSAFNGIGKMKELVWPKGVTEIEDYVFRCCYIDTIVIPEGVTTIGKRAFEYGHIRRIVIPVSVTSIGEGAFNWTYDLTGIYYAGTDRSAITIGTYNDDLLEATWYYGYDGGELFTPGDLDGDGEITDWDGVLLARYLAGWNVEIDLAATDVDGDGEVTDWDGVVLDRYLAGWNVTIG